MLNRENKIVLSDAGQTSAADLLSETLSMHHVTQIDLAKRIDISQKHLSKIINKKAFMSLELAQRIEIVTGIPAKILIRLDANYRLAHEHFDNTDTDGNYLKRYSWAMA